MSIPSPTQPPRLSARIVRFVAIAVLLGPLVTGIIMNIAEAAGSETTPAPTLQLASQLQLATGGVQHSDVWAWVHPQTNKEYAFVGEWQDWNHVKLSLHIVDVSDWQNPVLVKSLTNVPAFDMKTYDHYLYLVDGDWSGTDGEVWDIQDPANPVEVGGFGSHHNIWISDDGYMYAAFPGLMIYDLNPDPVTPTVVWYDSLFDGHDAHVAGDLLVDFHGYSGTFLYDITTRSSPALLGSITDPDIFYHHSGWTTADGHYLYLCDELATDPTPDITIWDISNPATPSMVGSIADPDATVHNALRVGDYLYVSYYNAGLKVFGVGGAYSPTNPTLIDEFDTSAVTGEGYDNGCWGIYPFSPTRKLYASDMDNGLFVFCFETPVGIGDPPPPGPFALEQNYPNPFNPTTTIMFNLEGSEHVFLAVYDPAGRRVRTLLDEVETAGPHSVNWDGTDDAGRSLASGVYFYRLRAGGFTDSRRMVLIK